MYNLWVVTFAIPAIVAWISFVVLVVSSVLK
jgi:hypothetical protein